MIFGKGGEKQLLVIVHPDKIRVVKFAKDCSPLTKNSCENQEFLVFVFN